MNGYIGQQSNWDPAADEAARRRIEKQKHLEQDKPDPQEEEAARTRMEEQRRREEEWKREQCEKDE